MPSWHYWDSHSPSSPTNQQTTCKLSLTEELSKFGRITTTPNRSMTLIAIVQLRPREKCKNSGRTKQKGLKSLLVATTCIVSSVQPKQSMGQAHKMSLWGPRMFQRSLKTDPPSTPSRRSTFKSSWTKTLLSKTTAKAFPLQPIKDYFANKPTKETLKAIKQIKHSKACDPHGIPAKIHNQGEKKALLPTTHHNYENLETRIDTQWIERCQNHYHIKERR